MVQWLNLGDMLRVNARKYANHICLADAHRRFTYPETNARVNRLASGLVGLGLGKGDAVSAFLENCIEFVELYLAAAKIGVVVNPINLRLTGDELAYVANDAGSSMLIVHDEFVPIVDSVRRKLTSIPSSRFAVVGLEQDGYLPFENILAAGSEEEPEVEVLGTDAWILLYTSGTTGKPKGVIRSHDSYTAFYLINACDFGFKPEHTVMNIMPLCHVNSTFFTFNFIYVGGSTYVHPARGFDALEILRIVERETISFVSLIPTHYSMILAVPDEVRRAIDVSSIKKLLCSSAPARVDQKIAIMAYFEGVELYEGYGSTEAGIVTTLFPHEQLTKPGSIGRESSGTDLIRILDQNKCPLPRGEVGEIYSRGPMLFDGYHNMPEKTAEAFAGNWFSAGDMGYVDEDGYYYLVDRKDNMIITGGEHVFPSEVERVIGAHSAVFDVAVVGVPHEKWGDAVTAFVILHQNAGCSREEIVAHCRRQLASFKVPKNVRFISAEEMPRNATGKILHRVLREREHNT